MKDNIADYFGWLGFFLIVSAYLLLTVGKIEVNTLSYHLPNLVGSAGLIVNAKVKGAIPLLSLNIIWFLVALEGVRAVIFS